jgi:SulP family sulfate permease
VATLPELVVDMIENQSRLRSTIETGLRDLFGGAISGVVSVVYCVSYAAFIFSGPLAPWLGYGIAATFISTTIGASVVALRSSVPFTIAGPDSSTSVVTATLVAAFVQWLVANGATDHVLGSTLFLMALSSALVGILLCGLGLAGAGRAVRFVPYPVIGGFSRGDRMADGFRCESGHYRHASCRCQH